MQSLLLTAFVFVILCCLTGCTEQKQSLVLAHVTSDDISYTVDTSFDFDSWLVELTQESDDLWEQPLTSAFVSTVEAHMTVEAFESTLKQQLLLAPAKSDVETAKLIAEVETQAKQANEPAPSLSKKELISRMKSKGYHVTNASKLTKAEVRKRYNEMLELEARGLRIG